jgi:AAA family ATP:ADP antiporter
MNLRHALAETFSVRAGEAKPIALMGAYSFLIGIFLAYFISLANAFFLAEFGVEYLPHGYIATGLVGYVAGVLLVWLRRRLEFAQLLFAALMPPLMLTCLFWCGSWLITSRWLAFAMFICIGPFITLVYFVFRSLAGRLFNLRQGKRLFGLISSGDVVSSMIGFFSVPVLLRFFDEGQLLLIAFVALALCLVVLKKITSRFAEQLAAGEGVIQAQPRQGDFATLLKSRYFLWLFALSAAAIFGFYYIDYMFLTQLRVRFAGNTGQLAEFIGLFYGIIRIIELVFKTFLSGRLLGQYGLKFSLVSLPLLLLVVIGLAAAGGTLLGDAATVLFLLMAFAKLIERVLTKSLYDPSFNILYQPLDPDLRLTVQTKTEGMVQQVAVGLSGITLLLFNWIGSFELVLYVLVLQVGGWMVCAWLMHKEYRLTLLRNLENQAGSRSLRSDASSVDLLKDELLSLNPGRAVVALHLLKRIVPGDLAGSLNTLLAHPDSLLKRHGLGLARDWCVVQALNGIETLAQTAAEPQLNQVAQSTARELTQRQERASQPGQLAAWAMSQVSAERQLAPLMWRALEPGDVVPEWFPPLLNDDDPDVRRAALGAAAHTAQGQYLQVLVEYLSQDEYCNIAGEALAGVGERVLPLLEDYLAHPSLKSQTIARVMRLYGLIGGDKALSLLFERWNYPVKEVRYQVLRSLRVCGFQAEGDQRTAVRQGFEASAGNIVWNIASLLDLVEASDIDYLIKAQGSEMDLSRERIFLLLSLIYEARYIHLVRDSFKSGSNDGRTYALELIDAFMDPEFKEIILPLLDDLPLTMRLRRLETRFPQQRLGFEGRLKDIINCEYIKADKWTKACALYALAAGPGEDIADELVAQLFNPESLLRETAAWGIYRRDVVVYQRHLVRLPVADAAEVDRKMRHTQAQQGGLQLDFERVLFIKEVGLFAEIPEILLVHLADKMEEHAYEKGDSIKPQPQAGPQLHLVIEGEMAITLDGQHHATVGPKEVVGPEGFMEASGKVLEAQALEDCRVFSMSQYALDNFIADYVEAAGGVIQSMGSLHPLPDFKAVRGIP